MRPPMLALALIALIAAPARAQFAPPQTVAEWDEGINTPVVAAAGTRALIGWAHYNSKVLRYVARDGDSALSPPVTLPGQGQTAPDSLSLALDADGGPVAAWRDYQPGLPVLANGSIARVNGAFAGISNLLLGAGGDIGGLAVWFAGDSETSNGKRTFASLRPRGGGFPDAAPISAPNVLPRFLSASVAADGTAVAAWTAAEGGRRVVQAVVRSPGGAFGTPVTLPTGESPTATATLALPDGTALVAWQEAAAVMLATRPPGGDFGAPARVGDAGVPELAGGEDGTAALAIAAPAGLAVAVRPTGGPFGALTTVSDKARSHAVAVARDGSVIAVWTEPAVVAALRRPGAAFGPGVQISPEGASTVAAGGTVAWIENRVNADQRVESRLLTTSLQAGAAAGPGAPAADAKAPKLTLKVLGRRHGRLRVRIGCSEACEAELTARLKGRSFKPLRAALHTAAKVLALKVSKRTRGRITLRLRAADAAGNAATRSVKYRLR